MKGLPNRAAACRFFSQDKAVVMALEAYRLAAAQLDPPPGQAWFDEGMPWDNYTGFAEYFVEELCKQVNAAAVAAGVPYESASVYPGLGWGNPDGHNVGLLPPENAPFATRDNRLDNGVIPGAA
jgi:hypothetical protein